MKPHTTEIMHLFIAATLLSSITAFATDTPLSGDATAISFYDGEVDTFDKGATLFSDRKYKVAECPEWLKGKKFLRNSINTERFNIAKDGILTLLTPTICDHKLSASRAKYLEKKGFERISKPAEFQLFGKGEWDIARIYQKPVPGK